MRKTKIKQRMENAFNAFFAGEITNDHTLDVYKNGNHLRRGERGAAAVQDGGTLEKILKQTLFFFPGTLILYFSGIVLPVLIFEFFTKQYVAFSVLQVFFFSCIVLAATLMTWIGLGNIRNRKHFIIPASIFSVGVLWIIITAVLGAIFQHFGTRLFYKNDFLIYLFPLALIVPFLAKGWIERDL